MKPKSLFALHRSNSIAQSRDSRGDASEPSDFDLGFSLPAPPRYRSYFACASRCPSKRRTPFRCVGAFRRKDAHVHSAAPTAPPHHAKRGRRRSPRARGLRRSRSSRSRPGGRLHAHALRGAHRDLPVIIFKIQIDDRAFGLVDRKGYAPVLGHEQALAAYIRAILDHPEPSLRGAKRRSNPAAAQRL